MSKKTSTSSQGAAVPFAGCFVVLGVTGSISAYKAVQLCRSLVDLGAHVAPVLTEGALKFIGTPTFSALASEPAQTELFGGPETIPHTRLGRAADVVVVAPATATILAKAATGIGDDLLSATLLATKAPVVFCPAMHDEMWHHPSVQENVATLRRRGAIIVEPEEGRLAGGDTGSGRLAATESILAAVEDAWSVGRDFSGISVLVTAGGTHEPIDPVRFLGNRSSGKQGHAIAAAAQRRGAKVTLVTTEPSSAPDGMEVIAVETAKEMCDCVLAEAEHSDVVVMAAAVADFRPVTVGTTKWKKKDGFPEITLEETPDILAGLGSLRRPDQVLVGFAAETNTAEAEGQRKLKEKRTDLIVVNDVSKPGVGFGHETNAVTILAASGKRTDVPMAPKSTIADAVLDEVLIARAQHTGAGPDSARPMGFVDVEALNEGVTQ